MNDSIDSILKEYDIVDTIIQYVYLKKVGKIYKACCPFHPEKTPSFTIDIAENTYHCFGCQDGGDVVKFIMKKENLTREDAVEFLEKHKKDPIMPTGIASME